MCTSPEPREQHARVAFRIMQRKFRCLVTNNDRAGTQLARRRGVNTKTFFSADEIRARVRALDPWFHNIRLNGVDTAPDHFLGDYPSIKWQRFAHAMPDD